MGGGGAEVLGRAQPCAESWGRSDVYTFCLRRPIFCRQRLREAVIVAIPETFLRSLEDSPTSKPRICAANGATALDVGSKCSAGSGKALENLNQIVYSTIPSLPTGMPLLNLSFSVCPLTDRQNGGSAPNKCP